MAMAVSLIVFIYFTYLSPQFTQQLILEANVRFDLKHLGGFLCCMAANDLP